VASLPWHNELQTALDQRKAAARYRQNRVRHNQQGVNVIIDGKPLVSFCSNDYLGLAAHPAIKKAFIDTANEQGVGSGAAHLLTGHSIYHQRLEEALAEFTGQQKALLFSTGYMANLAVIDGLLTNADAVIQDKLNHASLLDGGRISEAKQYRYPHANMGLLHKRLHNAAEAEHKLIVSDGVFSMDGDITPLPEIMALAQQHKAAVVIDDAHGFGVVGEHGKGTIEHYNIAEDKAPIVVGTFGKALGTAGAFVAADTAVIDTLVQQARSYIYTTAQPAAMAAASIESLKLVEQESWRRDKLSSLITQFRAGAEQLGLDLLPSSTPIQPVLIGDDANVLAVAKSLEDRGLLVGAIRPPTVPKGSGRLRITFSAEHEAHQVEQLLNALEQACVH
jgi:8-amino-7-oxononanoate synthase